MDAASRDCGCSSLAHVDAEPLVAVFNGGQGAFMDASKGTIS